MSSVFKSLKPYFIASLVVIGWLALSFLVSVGAGWGHLSEKYPVHQKFEGSLWYMQSATVGWMNYRSSMTVGSNSTSAYFAVFPLFRFAHPPIEIPYTDIHGQELPGIGVFSRVALTFDGDADTDITIGKWSAERMEFESGYTWRYERATRDSRSQGA